MTSTVPSAMKSYECSNSKCIGRQNIDESFLSINTKTIERFGYQDIEDALDHYPQGRDVKCNQHNCDGSVTENTTFNLQILIELDIRTINNPTGRVASLADFPVTLNLKQQYRYRTYRDK